jgi:hypothetical protein
MDPVVTVSPTSFGAVEGSPVRPGDPLTITATATDPDTHTEGYDTTSVEADNIQLSQHTVLNFTDPLTIEWYWESVGVRFGRDVNPLTVIAPAESDTLVCVVTDAGGHHEAASCPVTVTPVPVIEPAFGICLDPYPVMSGTKHTRQQEYDAYVSACGQPAYLRVYLDPAHSTVDAFPSTWPVPGEVADFAGRGCVLSAKFDQVKLANGLYDAKLTSLAQTFPGTFLVIVDHHEMEGGAFTAVQWRAGAGHMASVINGLGLEHVTPWAILMDWTWDPASHRNPEDYWVPGMAGYAVDSYNVPSARHDSTVWKTPAQLMDRFVAWTIVKGVRAGWTEAGCCPDFGDPTRAAAWITGAVQYARDNELVLMSYFDAKGPKGYWNLRAIIQSQGYYPNALGAVTSITPDTARSAAWKAAINA